MDFEERPTGTEEFVGEVGAEAERGEGMEEIVFAGARE